MLYFVDTKVKSFQDTLQIIFICRKCSKNLCLCIGIYAKYTTFFAKFLLMTALAELSIGGPTLRLYFSQSRIRSLKSTKEIIF